MNTIRDDFEARNFDEVLAGLQPPEPSEHLRRRVLAMAPEPRRNAGERGDRLARFAVAAALLLTLGIATLLQVTSLQTPVSPASTNLIAETFPDAEIAPNALSLLGESFEEASVASDSSEPVEDLSMMAELAIE